MDRIALYNELYRYTKEYITEQSIYSPYVIKNSPTQSNSFPLVIFPKTKFILDDETLKHGERRYSVIIEIEIYAIDKTVANKKVSKQTIIAELEKLLYDVFEEHYGLQGETPNEIINADTNVSREVMRFTGKYKNNVFYRR